MTYRDDRAALQSEVSSLRKKLDATEQELEEVRRLFGQKEAVERELTAMASRLAELRTEFSGQAPRKVAGRRRRVVFAQALRAILVLAALGTGAVVLWPRGRAVSRLPVEPGTTTSDVKPRRTLPETPTVFIAQGICFVNPGADGFSDLAGMARLNSSGGFRAAVFDGRTGRLRWSSKVEYKNHTGTRGDLLCPTPDTVFVLGKDRVVRSFDALSGSERWNVPVEDVPASAQLGAGCAEVTLVDHTRLGLQLESGAQASCKTSVAKAVEVEWLGRAPTPVSIEVGGRRITMSAKPSGTQTVTVRAEAPGAWEQKLDIVALTNPFAGRLLIQGREGVAVVMGSSVDDASDMVLIGLDPATGRVLYRRSAGRANNWVPLFSLVGPYLYADIGFLRAYDPMTGEEVWRVSAALLGNDR